MKKKRKLHLALVLQGCLVLAVIILAVGVYRKIPEVQLELQLTPSPVPVWGNVMAMTPDPSQPTQAPVLRTGSKGDEVIRLQERLRELGYLKGSVDGQFGSETQRALTEFQRENGLQADGVAGSATFALIYSSQAKSAPENAVAEETVTPVMTEKPVETPEPTEEPRAARPGYVTEDGMPLLVNRSHLLSDSYETYDLICLNDYCPGDVVKIKYSDMYAEREAADALIVMLRAAISEGMDSWQISAAFRTVEDQQYLFDRQVKTYMTDNGLSRSKAISATRKTVADPGSSEHHIGTCFDITIPGKSFGSTKQATWMAENCWDYGFILRYTKEKESITGFLAEPWHFRWVGLEHAKIMHEENLCLEEYIDMYGGLTETDEVL
ncbi:MAG: D-alanyl-D-alanine carboxypeptidase family protein [Clostridia bacterium]|nr:D-alanyl-D-alanine carboxypeptidase family protein [Clostridia bacterium]